MDVINSANRYFADEVIIQILARLPIKSLFRFRSVCKYWYRLPRDKYFVQLYNEFSFKNSMILVEFTVVPEHRLICVDHVNGVCDLSLDFLKDMVSVRASCNGLLCCSSLLDKGVYYVCNPVTREYKLLPSREKSVTKFSPDGDATLVGIACDLADTWKFKVVLAGHSWPLGFRTDKKKFICMVYDSEMNEWKKFEFLHEDYFTETNRNQVVFVNGMLHWLTGSYSCIHVLDLEIDVWKKIHLPDEMGYGAVHEVYLLELDGSLSVIQISEAWMNIWMLEDYTKQYWRLMDRVSLRCIRGLVPGIFPISQTNECIFLATYNQVLSYQKRTRVWKEMYTVKSNSCVLFGPLPMHSGAHYK